MSTEYAQVYGELNPALALDTISKSNFAWRHPATWLLDDGAYWAQQASACNTSLRRSPRVQHRRGRPLNFHYGRWILKEGDARRGWAEVHHFHSCFEKATLCLALDDLANSEQVSFLISAIFIVAELDIMTICPLSATAERLIAALTSADTSSLWTPTQEGLWRKQPTGQEKSVFLVSESDWWEMEQAQQDRNDLAYLVKRMQFQHAREQRRAERKKRPRYRGLIGFMSPWKK